MDKAKAYIKETLNELLYKVTWPTWEQLQSDTTLVIVSSIVFSLLIFAMDFVFGANPENGLFKGILYHVYELF
jgi:preprotein translocase subunit SecE